MQLPRVCLPIATTILAVACAGSETHVRGPQTAKASGLSAEAAIQAGRFDSTAWQIDLGELTGRPTQATCVQVLEDQLLVQDQEFILHAIDRNSGTHDWILDVGGEIAYPLSRSGGAVIVVTGDDLIGVDAATGVRLTRQENLDLDFWPWGPAAHFGNTFFVGQAAPPGVRAVDSSGRGGGWRYSTRAPVRQVMFHSDQNQLIAIAEDGLIVALPALNASSKPPTQENWFRRIPNATVTSQAVLTSGKLYVGADDGFLYCLDARNGAILWKTACEGPISSQRPQVFHDIVFVRAADALHALNTETGAELWSCEQSARCITRIEGRCYVEAREGAVMVRNAATGKVLADFDGYEQMPEVPAGGQFIAGDGHGSFVCLR